MGKNIFINDRREDAQSAAGRLYDALEKEFDRKRLFFDVDSIPPGKDFVRELHSQVAECGVFLAVIGKQWSRVKDEFGARRLDNVADWVRIEIEAAFEQKKHVIPVFVDGAERSQFTDLPESLASIARLNAVRLTHERFKADVLGLVYQIGKFRDEASKARLPASRELSSVISAVTFLLDRSIARAVLLENGDAGADLLIYREPENFTANAPFESVLERLNAAWSGRMAGTMASLEVGEADQLVINSGNEAIGRSRWNQSLAIAWEGNEFIVARIQHHSRDTITQNSDDYDLDFVAGTGMHNGKRVSITAPPPNFSDWSDERSIAEYIDQTVGTSARRGLLHLPGFG